MYTKSRNRPRRLVLGLVLVCAMAGAASSAPATAGAADAHATLNAAGSASACAAANDKVAKARAALKRAKKKLANASSNAAKRRARKKVKKAKRALARARSNRKQACANHRPTFPNPLQSESTTYFHYDSYGHLSGADTKITVRSPATDPDGDPITYSWKADNGSITSNRLSATWHRVISYGEPEPGTVTLTAKDGRGGFAQVEFDFN